MGRELRPRVDKLDPRVENFGTHAGFLIGTLLLRGELPQLGFMVERHVRESV
jgi:hypothetical protein